MLLKIHQGEANESNITILFHTHHIGENYEVWQCQELAMPRVSNVILTIWQYYGVILRLTKKKTYMQLVGVWIGTNAFGKQFGAT